MLTPVAGAILSLRRTKRTVDGSGIWRSPVEVGNLSHDLQFFFTTQVVQDVFHQPYETLR